MPLAAHHCEPPQHAAAEAHRLLALGVPAKDVRLARAAEWRSGEAGVPSERL